ncbi:hypothetical protein THASP1DRAFT_31287 [Thamnocephalis sphaerospora]|uniref:BAR domain-containing protein n=1 Tax=Thamnocephalis sphaerospora TaxID=78915 RepID=A0A4P9XLY2_9FUNG|nr:hypothetical protein THASP1DRAFT_31287 [Thamnocephalis sphaerospora]|eukprot:RKP06898.1 hypothetical protein THASP1DRAFT_31287 [Thamnocephalis sphaerospora]
MSWKGLKKNLVRLPAMLRESTGRAQETHDAEYDYLAKRFTDFQSSAQRLNKDATVYRDAIKGLLEHEKDFAETLSDLYRPLTTNPTESGQVDGQPVGGQANPQAMQAVEQYVDVMREVHRIVLPELTALDTKVIAPTKELLQVIKSVQKTMEKRDRKRLDYDRHNSTFQSLSQKTERSLNDEKKYRQAEQSVNEASDVFQYINTQLKNELPQLLNLRIRFITPCFRSFCQLQGKINTQIHTQLQQLLTLASVDYTHTATDGYQMRSKEVEEILTSIQGIAGNTMSLSRSMSRPPSGQSSQVGSRTASRMASPFQSSGKGSPSVGPDAATPLAAPNVRGELGGVSSPLAKGMPALPPKPPGASHAGHVIALYDFNGQSDGDLSFRAGDRIDIITRTDKTDDWWTGRVGHKTGLFPANYVKDDSGPSVPAAGSSSQGAPNAGDASPPPPYAAASASPSVGSSTSTPAVVDEKKRAPLPTMSSFGDVVSAATASRSPFHDASEHTPHASHVVALFDFPAQQPGDLGFRRGDRIEVLNRSDNVEDWWTGRLNGKEGMFPGNYVKDA